MSDVILLQNRFSSLFKPSINPSLYEFAISIIIKKYKFFQSEIYILPPHIYVDILDRLYSSGLHIELARELCSFENLVKALKAHKKSPLHRIFQSVMNLRFYDNEKRASSLIAAEFVKKFSLNSKSERVYNLINRGLIVSSFFSESGWHEDSEIILLEIQLFLSQSLDPKDSLRLIEICQRLLANQNAYYKISASEKTYRSALNTISLLNKSDLKPDYAPLFTQFSIYFLLNSDYQQAYNWSMEALERIRSRKVHFSLIDTLRQASKVCILKRQFKRAELLIRQAFLIAKAYSADNPVKYGDVLGDLGFFYFKVDSVAKGVEIYQSCLEVRKLIFGLHAKNLLLAIAYEDLAYVSYVHNYSYGFFQDARTKAEKAISIFKCLVPSHHFLLTNCKRIKALILEEIALDNNDKVVSDKHLKEALDLHSEAYGSSFVAFGPRNLLTAKNMGNLGRLYQSMKNFKKAESMLRKAIEIKEENLGPDDYEVSLSVGHLASLYNYDLGYYKQAEELYLRSIDISKKLFGDSYSGLEYDYIGLRHVYSNLPDPDKKQYYSQLLNQWSQMREKLESSERRLGMESCQIISIEQMMQEFNSL